jgi:hypothetical protein
VYFLSFSIELHPPPMFDETCATSKADIKADIDGAGSDE